MKNLKLLGLLTVCALFSTNIIAQTKMVGGAEMLPTKNIVENAMNSKDLTTLVAAIKEADLVSTLESRGPFTVFAPVDNAFAALPAGTVDNLLNPENRKMLTSILTYHVISGKFSAGDLMKRVQKENGKATMRTVQGKNLYFTMKGGNLMITDSKGNMANITIADVNQSNGVIHVIDKVLMP